MIALSTTPPPDEQKRKKKLITSVIIASIAIHLIGGGAAAIWIVARYFAPPKAQFVAIKEVRIPAKEREHKLNMAEFDALAPKPAFNDKIASLRPAKLSLPDLPKVPLDQVMPIDPSALITEQVSALVGASGDGSGDGSGGKGGGGMGGVGMSFFGIRDKGTSVVIMIDVSDSMFTRTGDAEGGGRGGTLVKQGTEQSFQAVREQALALVDSLGPNTRFGIVRWSGGAYSWKPELVAANDQNKLDAREHIQNQVDMKTARPKGGRPGGTRHDYALEEAFKLRPEVIYMLTDGNATQSAGGGGLTPIPADEIWDAAKKGQASLEKGARLHVIYYLTGNAKADEERMLRVLASRNDGRFKKERAKNAGEGSRNNRNNRSNPR